MLAAPPPPRNPSSRPLEKASAPMSKPIEFDQYDTFLREVKDRIATARVRAALAVNAELIALYWQIGRMILDRQEQHGWGGKVIDRLAVDLRTEFPGTQGFSRTNLHYARKMAAWYPDHEFVPQPVGQIPWGHVRLLIDKLDNPQTGIWYALKTIENGWSRNVLAHQIKTRLHERQGKAISNFDRTLPAPQSDLAREALKSTYNFEFLGFDDQVSERTLEDTLVERIQRFLLELGSGFAFVGRQYRLVVGGDEFFVDMLFYHLRLRCFIVVELKTRRFTPEDAGKLAFYRAVIDGELRHPDDQPTIGLVLCADHDETVVEYTLQDIAAPVAVSDHTHVLPTPEELRTAIDEGRRAYLEAHG
jgi:predicted nuclease of restriction endonuclease-like (RecB) superfamily